MLTIDDLIGYQLAEYAVASRLKTWLLILQFLVALPAALSIFVESNAVATYALAIVGLLALLAWLGFDLRLRGHRDAAERARRAGLVIYGLDAKLSAAELREIADSFKVTPARAAAAFRPNYFASVAPPGPRRLAQMVEESAYYTADLQRGSALFMGVVFGSCVLVLLLGLGAALAVSTQSTLMVLGRLFLVFLVFALSSDVWGAVQGHLATASTSESVYRRLAAAGAAGYPLEDVLLIVGDYNAAADSSPLTVPIVFRWRRERLGQLWGAYEAARSGTPAVRLPAGAHA
jgi:hypothetical protein